MRNEREEAEQLMVRQKITISGLENMTLPMNVKSVVPDLKKEKRKLKIADL